MLIEWSYTLAGAFTGFIIGLTGIGGGALMAPILILIFDISVPTVIGTDLWFAALTKIATLKIHSSHNSIDWKITRRLWLGSIPTSVFIIFGLVSEKITKLPSSLLQRAIGILLLLTSLGLALNQKNKIRQIPKYFLNIMQFNTSALRLVTTVAAGCILGGIVTLTSVGAGVLGTLVLIYLYSSDLTPKKIVATDIAHAIPLALLAGLGHLIYGKVDVFLLLSLLSGSVPFAMLGAKMSNEIPSKYLKISLVIIVFLSGLKLMAVGHK